MPRSPKAHSSPDASPDTPEVRRRVVRACQRCRLKKCKCDGATPCARCRSDDMICTYGRHKKSDKTVFRLGYVQMLELQHAQLIAGIQELYRRTQNGHGWTDSRLDTENYRQPLTHKILEALGVLQPNEWQGMDMVNENWQGVEKQGPDENGLVCSKHDPPSTQAAFSPAATAFPQSIIMSKRRAKPQTSLTPTLQTLSMPPPFMASPACIKPEIYSNTMLTQMPTPSDVFPSYVQTTMGLTTHWSLETDHVLSNVGGQEQLAEGY